jgi:hypothetical protein
MPKYVIEREIPAAGKLSSAELHTISQTSCGVLRELWITPFLCLIMARPIPSLPSETPVVEARGLK